MAGKRIKHDPEVLPQDAVALERTPQQAREALRRKVRMFYDMQALRMGAASRTLKTGEVINLHPSDLAVLSIRAESLRAAEEMAMRDVEEHLKTIPMYARILSTKEGKKRFKGLGPTMAAVLLSENDITRQDTVSKMWSYAGLRPMPYNRCNECATVIVAKDEGLWHPPVKDFACSHLEGVEDEGVWVTDADVIIAHKAARPVRGQTLPYNAFLRAKLIGVLAPCLLKCNSPWRVFYDNYKTRKTAEKWGASDKHRHNAAMRYMIKNLLITFHREWRTIEGLPVREPYQVEYLKHDHHEMLMAPRGEDATEAE